MVAAASCEATPVAVAPAAQRIEIRKADPPKGAREIGPIEAMHGSGCGLYGAKGTYDSALAELRNKTAEMGGNYVEVLTVTEPHSETGCFDNRFVIRGVVFQVRSAPVEAPVENASSDSCSPPCSPGYACEAGVCRAQCNPACGANQVCRQDRVCGPASP
jgi:hypothetical protein